MNLARIDELDKLIGRLYGMLRELKERKGNLEREVSGAESAQGRMDAAAVSAKNRVSSLAMLGLRSEFLEAIIRPVQNTPDCSGIGAVVKCEISETEDEIRKTNSKIFMADKEKKQLEMEDA